MTSARFSRRQFMRQLGVAGALGAGSVLLPRTVHGNTPPPGTPQNVLFISIDDLNDFPAPFGGYGGIHTPNIDRLAREGVVFQNAYCAGPYCGASRSSTLTGAAPHRTGVVSNQNILDPTNLGGALARLNQQELFTIPRYFRSKQYKTLGGGKIFHGGFGQGVNNKYFDEAAWDEYFGTDFLEIAQAFPGVKNYRDARTQSQIAANETPPGDMPSMIGADYNTIDREVVMPDRKLAQWAANKLVNHEIGGQPFFMALGFYRPHIAMYVPQRFYDMYPLASIRVPDLREQLEDIADLPRFAIDHLVNMEWTAYGKQMPSGAISSDHYLLQAMTPADDRSGHAQCIQAYLASISFVDECLGQVLDALEHSGLRDSTTIVLWSDHGWFLGEKLTWQKYKVWERATRVPLIVSTPGGARGNCHSVVSLLDVFPTLLDLTGGTGYAQQQLDGKSFRSMLDTPECTQDTYAITTQSLEEAGFPGDTRMFHSLRTQRWRYIRYPAEGQAFHEELYDMTVDPNEKKNLLYWEPDRHEGIRAALDQVLTSRVGA